MLLQVWLRGSLHDINPSKNQGGENSGNESNLDQLLKQSGLHPEEILLVPAEGKITSMQSLAAKSKRTLQMLSRVRSMSLILMFMLC